jgi:hypothetical protein
VSSYNFAPPAVELIKKALTEAKNAPDLCFPRTVDVNEGDVISAESFPPFDICLVSNNYPPISCSCDRCKVNQKLKIPISAKCPRDSSTCYVYFNSDTC